LTLDRHPDRDVHLVYCDTGSEHPDNVRFLRECEAWLGQDVEVIKSTKYDDIWDVFDRTRWLVGPNGARCTTELKRVPRKGYQHPEVLHVFGYDATERHRAVRLVANNPEIYLEFPLLEAGMSKVDCARMVKLAGIELPAMYLLGYRNNNCIGCVKGQQGYWNKIRVDFPEVFARMASVERALGAAINKRYEGDTRIPVYLDELSPQSGNYSAEPEIQCGLSCGTQVSLFDWRPA